MGPKKGNSFWIIQKKTKKKTQLKWPTFKEKVNIFVFHLLKQFWVTQTQNLNLLTLNCEPNQFLGSIDVLITVGLHNSFAFTSVNNLTQWNLNNKKLIDRSPKWLVTHTGWSTLQRVQGSKFKLIIEQHLERDPIIWREWIVWSQWRHLILINFCWHLNYC